jgi:hypothetical protein
MTTIQHHGGYILAYWSRTVLKTLCFHVSIGDSENLAAKTVARELQYNFEQHWFG